MIPSSIEAHLRLFHAGWEHRVHPVAKSAQELAANEHVSGYRVAKPVAVKLGGKLAIAVVSAVERVRLRALEEELGEEAELVVSQELVELFRPCDPGAEPPLRVFDVPIFVDANLAREPRLVMPGGTYQDAIVLDTAEWMRCERVQSITDLGAPVSATRR
jgi:Ala-tRNA(Pro) deacylase